jgi:hypothetical protein
VKEALLHTLNTFHLLPDYISCQRELRKGNEDTFDFKALREQEKIFLRRIVENRF